MNYTRKGQCSLELEAKRNALEMKEFDVSVKEYINWKMGIPEHCFRNISEEDFLKYIMEANKKAEGRKRISCIEMNALINVLQVGSGSLDLAFLMERIEINLGPKFSV